ncbi:hypothetical protein [Azospirillum aestuarii]|uniref:hypothetical protein n=1 Tax=Azospirillum aestuarii TaxID=2802052 RepID=UPI004054F320
MEEGHNFRQLRDAILALSAATDWEVARKEWSLVDISEADEAETCLCGHFPIIEICTIANRVTGKRAEIGNRCVKRFMGLRSDLIFAAIKRIRKDITKSLNADAIVFFWERGLLTAWEYRFLQDTMAKRSLSPAQAATRAKLNQKVLDVVKRRGFQGLN